MSFVARTVEYFIRSSLYTAHWYIHERVEGINKEHAKWNPSFESVSVSFSYPNATLGFDKNETNCDSTPKGNLTLATAIPVSILALLVLVLVLTVMVIKRRKMVEEKPKVDDNIYYGEDEYGYMDSIRDHRVIDNNEYYE